MILLKKKFKKMFFFVGMGRSGSEFLAHLLNAYTPAAVYHEHRFDSRACVAAYWSQNAARQYLCYRSIVILCRTLFQDISIYGEVNSYLRYHVDALRDKWNPLLFHLVRDGRSVVRSMMNRSAYTSDDVRHTGRIKPIKGDPFLVDWESRDRFEKVCWYWADANKRLLNKGLLLVRFEDMINSYEYFKRNVLDPLNLQIDIKDWKKEKDRPRNINVSYEFPAWENWTKLQKYTFERVCGDVMMALGYNF